MEPGDAACLLLGSEMPIILKPATGGQYNVVGNCFMYGGELFLGPTPAGLREARYLVLETGEYMRRLPMRRWGRDPSLRPDVGA